MRDGPLGLEVFLVERHHRIDFASGALVFPGGKADPGDAEPEAHRRCRGVAGLPADAATARVAGIREAFEECGVLLARPAGGDALVDAGRAAALVERHAAALRADRIAIGAVAEAEDLELAGDALVPFAHWITPEFMPKRFDTHFFLAQAPPDQLAVHDGSESVDSLWMRPADALAAAGTGRRTVIFPTRMNLAKLARSDTVAQALAAARAAPVVTVLPRVVKGADGPRLCLPADAGYDVSEVSIEEAR